MGAATALYSATCFAHGRFTNGNPYPLNLRAIVGLSGWLPGSRSDFNSFLTESKPSCLFLFLHVFFVCDVKYQVTKSKEKGKMTFISLSTSE